MLYLLHMSLFKVFIPLLLQIQSSRPLSLIELSSFLRPSFFCWIGSSPPTSLISITLTPLLFFVVPSAIDSLSTLSPAENFFAAALSLSSAAALYPSSTVKSFISFGLVTCQSQVWWSSEVKEAVKERSKAFVSVHRSDK